MAQNGTRATGPRCIALVGPFQSGKTTLLEAILARVGELDLRADTKSEREHLTELTAYATALAMNYLARGKFVPAESIAGEPKGRGSRANGGDA